MEGPRWHQCSFCCKRREEAPAVPVSGAHHIEALEAVEQFFYELCVQKEQVAGHKKPGTVLHFPKAGIYPPAVQLL
ncbi:MAG TPA: hypothetical protein DEF25_07465 [Thermoanaerobacter sp.]|nr:hypothetical protein [Thermoanaerobacter sp.]